MEDLLVIRDAKLLTLDEGKYIEDGYIVFSENGIISLGENKDIPEKYASLPYEDKSGFLIMPGFVNTHTHLGMVSFRSLADDEADRLKRFLMPLENMAMTKPLAISSAKIAIAEMIKAGVTSAVDMYYYEKDIAKAAAELGFRLWCGESILDAPHPGASGFEESLERTYENIEECGKSSLTTPIIAPHAPYSLSLEHLKECYETAEDNNLMWTMHLEEMVYEMAEYKTKYNLTPIEVFEKECILDDSLLAVHLVLSNKTDRDILAKHGAAVAHCPCANAKSAKGIAEITDLIGRSPLTLATDGPSSGNTLDLFTQMKAFALFHKNRLKDRTAFPARDIVPLAASEAGKALKKKIGMLKEGYEADFIAVSLDEESAIPCFDPYSVLVYSCHPEAVKDVWIRGKRVLKDREFTMMDIKEEKKRFRAEAEPFFQKAKEL